MMGFLKRTKDDVLTLQVDDVQILHWYINASFVVYHDVKNRSGLVFTLGNGAIISSSRKQKINSRNSAEVECNATDDMMSRTIRVEKFLKSKDSK